MNNLSSVSIESVLNHLNIKYKPSKKEELAICCVFHSEKTPSMHINTKKNVFNCKSCNKSGNTYDLVKEYLGLDSKDTFKWFSDKGIHVENSTPKPTYTPICSTDTIKLIIDNSTLLAKVDIPTEPITTTPTTAVEYLLNRKLTLLDYNYSGIRILNKDISNFKKNSLVAPIYSDLDNSTIISFQSIDPSNNKMFLASHPSKGCLVLEVNPQEHYYMVEGLVDGLSLNSAGFNAVVGFSLGNLLDLSIANIKHKLIQDKRITLLCDSKFKDRILDTESREYDVGISVGRILGNSSLNIEHKDNCKDINDLLKVDGIKGIKKLLSTDLEAITSKLKAMIKSKQLPLFLVDGLSGSVSYYVSYGNYTGIAKSVEVLKRKAFNRVSFLKKLNIDQLKLVVSWLEEDQVIKYIPSLTYDPSRKYLDVVVEEEGETPKINIYKDTPLMLKVKKELNKTEINEYVKGFPNIARLIKNLVDYDKISEKWLYQFLAFKLQNPTIVGNRNILVFYGRQKTGKNFFANILYALLGKNVDPCIETEDLLNSKFTDKICNKLFNFVNEVSDREKEPLMNKLKSLSGNNSIKYEKKGEPAVIYPAYATYVLLTNKEHIVNLDTIDTRFTFFKSTKELNEDIALSIPKNSKELERELANFYAFLLSYDLGNITSIKPLDNQARLDAVENSKSSVELLIEKIANNELDTIISEHNSKHKTELPYYAKEQVIHANSIYYYVKKEDCVEVDTSIIEKLIRNTDKYISLKQIHNLGKEVLIDGKQVYSYDATKNQKWYKTSKRKYVKILINTNTSEEA